MEPFKGRKSPLVMHQIAVTPIPLCHEETKKGGICFRPASAQVTPSLGRSTCLGRDRKWVWRHPRHTRESVEGKNSF